MRELAPWQIRYSRMLLFTCLLGLFSQYMFVGNAAGISVVLFLGGFYFIFFYAIKGRLGGFESFKGQSNAGWLLTFPILLLALSYALYANELFRVLNAFALPWLVAAQTMLLTRSSKHTWHSAAFFREVFYQGVNRTLANFPAPFAIVRELLPQADAGSMSGSQGNLRKVFTGLLIATPILVVVISLLASADSIFQAWLAQIPQAFEGVSVGDWFLRIAAAILIILCTFGYIWGLLFPKVKDKHEVNNSVVNDGLPLNREKITFDPVIAGTLLVSVNLVYVLFVVIQFSYLFHAAGGLLPEGTAYAEYARRGFAELVLVAMINLGLLLPGLHRIRPAGPAAERFRKLLLSMLVCSTVIMLISAYSRLSLYEEAYGFTQTRLLVHGFMLVLGAWLAIAFIRIWLEQISLSKAYLFIALTAYVAMNYVNLDYRIAENNIDRYERTGSMDVSYLGELSMDAMPALLEFQAKYPELESLQPIIDKHRHEALKDDKWPAWNLAKQRVK